MENGQKRNARRCANVTFVRTIEKLKTVLYSLFFVYQYLTFDFEFVLSSNSEIVSNQSYVVVNFG